MRPLRFEQHGRIAVLTLNCPQTRNALDDDVADAVERRQPVFRGK
jgi:enoyl-CoA hydratase/carnithine racemase